MTTINFLEDLTCDGLKLPLVHFDTGDRELCVIYIHGMAENLVEDSFARTWAKTLAEQNVGFLYGHTRGHSQINYIINRNGERVRYGTAYEVFDDCLADIDLFVKKAQELGYQDIVLLGHSLGCNKAIFYMSKQGSDNKNIKGVVLASPPDMVGLEKMPKYQDNYKELLNEAKTNVKNGQPRRILRSEIWGEYELSSQTYLSFYQDGIHADNLPILRNPDKFPQLEKIAVPILAFMGESDDIKIRSLHEDLALIKEKAINCPDFTTKIVAGANHYYYEKEQETVDVIFDWLVNQKFI